MHAPAVIAAASHRETDAIAAQAPGDARLAAAWRGEGAADALRVLGELELAGRQTPAAGDFCRNEIEERGAPARAGVAELRHGLLVPALDAIGVADDARARRQLQELGRELAQIGRQQEKREHRGWREIGFEHVALHELRALADAGR